MNFVVNYLEKNILILGVNPRLEIFSYLTKTLCGKLFGEDRA